MRSYAKRDSTEIRSNRTPHSFTPPLSRIVKHRNGAGSCEDKTIHMRR